MWDMWVACKRITCGPRWIDTVIDTVSDTGSARDLPSTLRVAIFMAHYAQTWNCQLVTWSSREFSCRDYTERSGLRRCRYRLTHDVYLHPSGKGIHWLSIDYCTILLNQKTILIANLQYSYTASLTLNIAINVMSIIKTQTPIPIPTLPRARAREHPLQALLNRAF